MGVHNLWTLLEPCGRRVDISVLRGRLVAIDASGWIFRFIKAMRNDKGELLPNAHLVGFIRRICKLLHHNIRPVFVFDGATPALKRRTVLERRRRMERQAGRVRLTAEKLLQNRIRQHVLETTKTKSRLGNSQESRDGRQEDDTAQRNSHSLNKMSETSVRISDFGEALVDSNRNDIPHTCSPQEGLKDEFQSTSKKMHAEDSNEHEGWPEENATDIKRPKKDGLESRHAQIYSTDLVDKNETLESMKNASVGFAEVLESGSTSDEEEGTFDFMIPTGYDEIDPEVLATLPPSLQLDIMLRLRDQNAAANRSAFEDRSGMPQEFSKYQIENYLKSSHLKRQLDVMRGMAGSSSADLPKPIAAEEGREYILTSNEHLERKRDLLDPSAETALANNNGQNDVSNEGKNQNVHISFEVPVDANDSDDDDFEWQDVDEASDENKSQKETASHGGSQHEGNHWRIRAAKRQKFWSTSHGFQKGRSLARWTDQIDKEFDLESKIDKKGEGIDGIRVDHNMRLDNTAKSNNVNPSRERPDPEINNEGFAVDDSPIITEDCKKQLERQSPDQFSHHQKAARNFHLKGNVIDLPIEQVAFEKDLSMIDQFEESMEKVSVIHGNKTYAGLSMEPKYTSYVTAEQDNILSRTENAQKEVAGSMVDMVPRQKRVIENAGIGKSKQASGSLTEIQIQNQNQMMENKDFETIHKRFIEDADVDNDGTSMEEPATRALGKQECKPDLNPIPKSQIQEHNFESQNAFEDEISFEKRSDDTFDHLQTAYKYEVANVGFVKDSPKNDQSPKGIVQQPFTQVQTIDEKENDLVYSKQPSTQVVPASLVREPSENLSIMDKNLFNQSNLDLAEASKTLESEEMTLRMEYRAAVAQSDTPTDAMFADIQELLGYFGIPYIIAPGEAEAQCAWLDASGLVEGVITDDNDAFLFGARLVYRNIFEDKRYVEEYRAQDMESELGLGRKTLVALGLLLGCDYSLGIDGVGVVNAMEIVSSFGNEMGGLKRFADWLTGIDADELSQIVGSSSQMNGNENEMKHFSEAEKKFFHDHSKLRNIWVPPEDFPSEEVFEAFLKPRIDTSKVPFKFAKPDIDMIQKFCAQKLNWNYEYVQEVLQPALKAIEEQQVQQTLDKFVTLRQRFAKIKSKRLQTAIKGIVGELNHEIAYNDNNED